MNKFLKTYYIYIIYIIAALKLLTVSTNEIIQTNSPHDSYWYVNNANNYIWGGGFNVMSQAHLPLYSLFIKMNAMVGLPLRLSTEILWICGTLIIGKIFFKAYKTYFISIIFITFLLFHPVIFKSFDWAVPDIFLTITTLYILIFIMKISYDIKNDRYKNLEKHFIYLAIAISIAINIRAEGVVYLFTYFIFLLYFIINYGLYFQKIKFKKLLFILPFILTISLSTINYFKYSQFSTHSLANSSYKGALKSILSVDAPRAPRFVSVSFDAMKLMSNVSPTFFELYTSLTKGSGRAWMAISEINTGIKGEIANGWFYWAIRDAANEAGWFKTPELANKKFEALTAEFQDLFSSGILKRRKFVYSSYIDPDYYKWIPFIFESYLNILNQVLFATINDLEMNLPNATLNQQLIYTKMLGTHSIGTQTFISGWIKTPKGVPTLLLKKDGIVLFGTSANVDLPRGDVGINTYSFSINYIGKENPSEIEIKYGYDKYFKYSLNDLKIGVNGSNTSEILIGIEVFNTGNKKNNWYDKNINNIIFGYHLIGYLLTFSLVFPLFFIRNINNTRFKGDNLIVIFIISLIFFRVSVFAILDASSWSALQIRYLMPIIPALFLLFSIQLALLVEYAKNK